MLCCSPEPFGGSSSRALHEDLSPMIFASVAEPIRNFPLRFRVAALRPREQNSPFRDAHLVWMHGPTRVLLCQLPGRFGIDYGGVPFSCSTCGHFVPSAYERILSGKLRLMRCLSERQRYRAELEGRTIWRAHATGAFHSRTIENRIPAENSAKIKRRFFI